MGRRTPRIAGLAGALVILGGSAVIGVRPAGADTTVPFTDTNAVGYVGFCDAHNRQVRSGSIGAAPFAVKAVASVPAPAGYQAGVGKSVLLVYQPIKGVAPTDWSGKQLTAASSYTNTSYPMSQGLTRDPALVDFTAVFPPQWDNLLQVRMYYTSPDRPQHSEPYPATVVRVDGNTWTQVNGGDVNCAAGSATSFEAVALPKSAQNVARATPGATVTSGAAGRGGATTPSAGATGTAANASNAANATSSSARRKSSSSTGWILPVVLIAVAAAGAAVVVALRRRTAATTGARG